ncbi:hypothetical protein [Actinoplanes sp. NPDC049802]|uniref:hypothetical protein n=1 Tax=Actinoplanes sp. NPDC049802 TaxID=3154742 RepID=UPI0033C22943
MVEPALLDPGQPGLIPVEPDPPYGEDIASHVCANGPASGAVSSAFGRSRGWRDDSGTSAWQFAGVFGEVTAAEVIVQVEGMLGCGEYEDWGSGFRGIHKADLPVLAGADRRLMFCESTDEEPSRCTVLLAGGPVLSRLIVRARTEERAADLACTLAVPAAAALR